MVCASAELDMTNCSPRQALKQPLLRKCAGEHCNLGRRLDEIRLPQYLPRVAALRVKPTGESVLCLQCSYLKKTLLNATATGQSWIAFETGQDLQFSTSNLSSARCSKRLLDTHPAPLNDTWFFRSLSCPWLTAELPCFSPQSVICRWWPFFDVPSLHLFYTWTYKPAFLPSYVLEKLF